MVWPKRLPCRDRPGESGPCRPQGRWGYHTWRREKPVTKPERLNNKTQERKVYQKERKKILFKAPLTLSFEDSTSVVMRYLRSPDRRLSTRMSLFLGRSSPSIIAHTWSGSSNAECRNLAYGKRKRKQGHIKKLIFFLQETEIIRTVDLLLQKMIALSLAIRISRSLFIFSTSFFTSYS